MIGVKQGHFWVLTEKKEKKTHCRQQALQLRVCDLQIKESRVF